MAGITYTPPSNGAPNPTTKRVPVNIAGAFADSNILNQVNDLIQIIAGATAEGLEIDLTNGIYKIGAVDAGTLINLVVDKAARRVYTESGGNEGGLDIDTSARRFSLGEFAGGGNGTTIVVDDTNQRIEVNGAVITGTASGASGDHLQITINSTPYVIELKTP